MSELVKDLQGLAKGYLDGKISLDEFRGAFAGLYFRARQRRSDVMANRIASNIMGPLAEFARRHRSEASLREEISSALHADSLVAARVVVGRSCSYGSVQILDASRQFGVSLPRSGGVCSGINISSVYGPCAYWGTHGANENEPVRIPSKSESWHASQDFKQIPPGLLIAR
jgi:hypothetical protein